MRGNPAGGEVNQKGECQDVLEGGLLHVQDSYLGLFQYSGKGRGDAGPVAAGDGDDVVIFALRRS